MPMTTDRSRRTLPAHLGRILLGVLLLSAFAAGCSNDSDDGDDDDTTTPAESAEVDDDGGDAPEPEGDDGAAEADEGDEGDGDAAAAGLAAAAGDPCSLLSEEQAESVFDGADFGEPEVQLGFSQCAYNLGDPGADDQQIISVQVVDEFGASTQVFDSFADMIDEQVFFFTAAYGLEEEDVDIEEVDGLGDEAAYFTVEGVHVLGVRVGSGGFLYTVRGADDPRPAMTAAAEASVDALA